MGHSFLSKKPVYILLIIVILSFGILADAQNKQNKRSQRISIANKQQEEVVRIGGDCVTEITHIFTKDLPLARFSNPYITNRIYEEINKRKYLQGDDDELYIAPTPDSIIVLSRCSHEIWFVTEDILDKEREYFYTEYIGHIRYNGHIIPIVTDEKYPIPWMELDSTEMANALIKLDGIPCKNGWSIISVKGMLSEPEPIDSLTRNEMIHSWFDK